MSQPTRVLDRYEIIRPLGQGGFGSTYLGRDVQLDRPVVLKVLRSRGDTDLKAFELFQREASVLRELRHPGVPAIHASFRAPWNGTDAAMLVMEYVEGTSLDSVIADRRHLDSEDVAQLFVEALGLLDYLHGRVPPVLHRDIKPANLILRTDRTLALVDFGAVRNVFHGAEESGSTIVGTYGYMPYEQYMGQASPASDLYALAATFLHLVTGRAPPEFLSSAGRLEVPASACGEPLRSVLVRMLAPAPTDRFQTARAARAALLGQAPKVTPSAAAVERREMRAAVSQEWEPLPRRLEGPTLERFRKVAYTGWQLLESDEGHSKASVMEIGLVVFLSILTAGIMPAIVWGRASKRRHRLKPFFLTGSPARATITDLNLDTTEFSMKLMRVRYEFEAEGELHRGTDYVLPALGGRWAVGDHIEVLYLAEHDYDSVIVSTR